ncbi:MAG: hypothetical protein Q9163_000048 [Psora crenata]
MYTPNIMSAHRLSTPPSSSDSEISSASEYPRPHFYVVRPDKTFVPLIAVDEISPMVRIHGVPSSLTVETIEKWNMARCGDQLDRHCNYYRVEFSTHRNTKPGGYKNRSSVTEGAKYSSEQADHGLDLYPSSQYSAQADSRTSPGYEGNQVPLDDNTQSFVNESIRKGGGGSTVEPRQGQSQHPAAGSRGPVQDAVDHMVQENRWAKEQHPSKTKNAATPGIFGKKKFCTYWIRTGNCDYVQEGCKYLHVIPDEETRLRIGIRDMPRWAKEDIPAPHHAFHEKPHSSIGQDWRRQGMRTGQIKELPETLPPQARPALPPPVISTTTNDGSNTSGAQNGHFSSTFFSFPAQHVPSQGSHLANQNSTLYRNTLNSSSSPSPFKPTGSDAVAPYQLQMQSATSAPLSIPPTPTSAAHRYSPPTQPPISRPVKGAYRAPDKMPNEAQAQAQNLTQEQARPFSPPTRTPSQYGSQSKLAGNGQADAPLSEDAALLPLPSKLVNKSVRSGINSPMMNGMNSSPRTITNTPSPQAHLTTSKELITVHHDGQHHRRMEVKTPSRHGQTELVVNNLKDIGNVHQASINNNDAAKRMINSHITGSLNKTSNGHIMGSVNNQAGKLSNDQSHPSVHGNIQSIASNNGAPAVTGPVVMHRRHFVAPGESQYVATTVEAEKAPVKKSGNGAQKKRPRGRGGNHADLIEA